MTREEIETRLNEFFGGMRPVALHWGDLLDSAIIVHNDAIEAAANESCQTWHVSGCRNNALDAGCRTAFRIRALKIGGA